MDAVYFHLAMNHFPVIASIFGLVILGYGVLRRSDPPTYPGLVIRVVTGLAPIPVYPAGEPAERGVARLPGGACVAPPGGPPAPWTSGVGRARNRPAGTEVGCPKLRCQAVARAWHRSGPFATLARGYAIVRTSDGRVIRSATTVSAGDDVQATLAEGALDLVVKRARD